MTLRNNTHRYTSDRRLTSYSASITIISTRSGIVQLRSGTVTRLCPRAFETICHNAPLPGSSFSGAMWRTFDRSAELALPGLYQCYFGTARSRGAGVVACRLLPAREVCHAPRLDKK